MLFYKVTATLNEENRAEEKNDRRVKEERARYFANKSEDYNNRGKPENYFFISELGFNGSVTCGIISLSSIDAVKCANSYFKYLGIIAKDLNANEITLSSMNNLLKSSYRCGYIENEDYVLERFGLDELINRLSGYRRGFEYSEHMLDETTDKSALYETSKRLLAENTLRPELDRIYSGKTNTKAFGHPVHYMLETDDWKCGQELSKTFLQALYDNCRIRSRRYCVVDVSLDREMLRKSYQALYKSCSEGTVIVRYVPGGDFEDDEFAESETETISFLCETMLKYRNKVLTVFCLPRACEKFKKTFYENLGSVGMVEVKEDLAGVEKSAEYLRILCRDERIRPDNKLYKNLEAEKEYLPDDLRKMFDEWYNDKMRTSVFPQYKDIAVCRKEAMKEVARGTAYDELHEMIGLSEAKNVIGKALNYYKLQKIYKDKGIKQDRPAMHMVFTGNPGTAKTTVARLFARIMRENGLLSKGHLVEVGRSDLVGKFVGWTAQIVKEKFKSAMGGVLFIDEAYSLVDDRKGMFGDEAINTIVQEMENCRDDLVVIFAGYPEEMESFLDKNPGLRSRIAFHVPFADYSTEELCDIAKLIGKSEGLSLTDKAVEKLATVFEEARTRTDFGNGRYVRNLLEISEMNRAGRILAMDPDLVDVKTLTSLEDEDIEIPVVKSEPKKRKIGFAS